KTVTFSGFALTGEDKNNYTLQAQPTAVTATINKAPLTVSSAAIITKYYQVSTNAAVSSVTFDGLQNGENLLMITDYTAAATFDSKDVSGTTQPVTLTHVTLKANAKTNNYTLSTSYPAARGTIRPLTVTLTGISANNKLYDGTTAATYNGTPTLNGVIAGDDVSINATSVEGTFNSKDKGTNKPVTFSDFVLTGAQSGNYQLSLSNFRPTANISAAPLILTGATIAPKTYDGTTTATVNAFTLSGFVSGDTLLPNDCATITAAFTTKDKGTGKPVNLTVIRFKPGIADNYALSGLPVATSGDINPKPVTLTGISANDTVYNGTTVATYSGTPTIAGKINGDDVSVDATNITVAFNDSTAGTQPVTFAGLTLAGAQKDNYVLTAQSTHSATIRKKPVTVSGISACDKVYDGDTIATVLYGAVLIDGIIPLDDGKVEIDITTGTAAFADKNVGTKKPVKFSEIT
uniref:YDG domain-containing protein n=1 Tax=Candidatus Symbiothrix dinenymphae TaxID=467085 RepID=UPI000A5CEE69